MSGALLGSQAYLPASQLGIVFGNTITAGAYQVGAARGTPDFVDNPDRVVSLEHSLQFATGPTTNTQLRNALRAMGGQRTILTATLPGDKRVVVARGTAAQIHDLSGANIRNALGGVLETKGRTVRDVIAGGVVTFKLSDVMSDLQTAMMMTLEDQSPKGFHQGLQPAVRQTWHEAATLAALIVDEGGRSCRLPIGVEWEVAAGKLRNVTREDLRKYAHFGARATAFVRRRQANEYGLHDMLGNVWEWQGNLYQPDQESRELRGGSSANRAERVRVSYRFNHPPDLRLTFIGFRVVVEV